jgi:lauroyl/myristoyl acyltransferase
MNPEDGSDRSDEAGSGERWPIGFMVLVGAIALYLGWRLIQGIGALIGWIAG